MTASYRLFATQLSPAHQERWLAEVQVLPDRAAYAMTRAGESRSGVTALEQGRALVLADRLRRDRADLEQLTALGYGDLAERYRAGTARLRGLQFLLARDS